MPRVDISKLSPEALEGLRLLAVSVIRLEALLLSMGASRSSIKEAMIESIPTTIFDGELPQLSKEMHALCDRVRAARVRKYPDVWRISDSLDSSIIKAALENVINAYDEP